MPVTRAVFLTRLAISSQNRARTSIQGRLSLLIACAALAFCLPLPCLATPFMWDQDGDGLDDRLESVALLGINQAFENADPDGRLRFEVAVVNNVLQYGGYVRYDHIPTPTDSLNAVLAGAQVVTRFQSVPYIRIRATWPSLTILNARPEVERIEAVTLMYSLNWKSGRAMGVRAGAGLPFPSVESSGGPTGTGVVVAILDTGINDTPQGGYPGHADLAGKVAGGATFEGPGPSGYTPHSGSVNPSQGNLGMMTFHATHLAGSIAGASRDRVFGGVAPGARLVDVKVLGDDGSGYGLAEGLEWCIQNRTRNWGGATGIQVINLSLSGTDASDGNDCACQLVNTAAALGMIVVASAGNDGRCGYMPSPAAADGAVTVGASDPVNAADPGDDVLAAFSNEGPRHTDGDGDPADEMKPDVVAPGVGIISAYGSPITDGRGYRTLSGTSMSAAYVSGLAALLREDSPTLTAAAFKTLLRATSHHRSSATRGCSPGVNPLGTDIRYHSGWGFGTVDAQAAREELIRPAGTQFVSLSAAWNGSGTSVSWTTQREAGLTGFLVQRAPDAGGSPGTFATVGGPVPAVGFANLSTGNRTAYTETDAAPAGQLFWYRVTTTGGSPVVTSQPFSVRTEAESGRARAEFTHNRAEFDFTADFGVGLLPFAPLWNRPVGILDRLTAASVDPLPASPNTIRYTIELPLHASDGAAAWLPPVPSSPWWFRAHEGGDPASAGSLTGFSIITPGQTWQTDSALPKATLEGYASVVWIPEPAASAADPAAPVTPALTVFPNPFRAAATIRFRLPVADRVRLSVYDVAGREIRLLGEVHLGAGDHDVSWDGRTSEGLDAAAGRYFIRARGSSSSSVVPVSRLR